MWHSWSSGLQRLSFHQLCDSQHTQFVLKFQSSFFPQLLLSFVVIAWSWHLPLTGVSMGSTFIVGLLGSLQGHGINSLSPLCLQSWVSTATETLPLKRMADGFSWHFIRFSSPCIQTFLLYDLFMPESYTLSGLAVSMRYTALAYSGPQLLTPRKFSQ